MSDAEKRSVHTDALATLGTIITSGGRDAIHIAVEPVIASQKLRPGQDIALREDGKAMAVPEGHKKAVGIVDPFLKVHVQEGEMFWLLIYPRQITSLRHVWSHPAFKDELTKDEKVSREDNVNRSELWLRQFCEKNDVPSYERVMKTIKGEPSGYEAEYGQDDYDYDYITFYGVDAHCAIPAEFWDHVENVLGKKIEKRPGYFSCSC